MINNKLFALLIFAIACSSGKNASCIQPLSKEQIDFLKNTKAEAAFGKSILTPQKSSSMTPDSNGLLEISGYDRISSDAFKERNDIITVIVNGASSIGALAFSKCSNLRSITFRGNLEDIGMGVCGACQNLTNVSILGSVKFIDSMAFRMCPNLDRKKLMKRFTGSHFHAKVNKDLVKWGKRSKARKEYEANRANAITEDQAYLFNEALNVAGKNHY